ncbi:MAG: alpha/beta hydrolase [Paracoccaceae bacterium]
MFAEVARGPVMDWDDAYANRAHVPDTDAIVEGWRREAPAFRASLGERARLDLPYDGPLGDPERERFDLFLPEGTPRGLVVFLHGGYWMSFDKSAWSHLAAGPLARGRAVAMPSCTLAPAARIAEVTRQAAAAVAAAADLVAGPVVVSGHSAGGHLAARMLCRDLALAPELRARLRRAVSISGVHDLRPLLRTAMNATLRLDLAEARAESPALREPVEGAELVAWVGGAERPEFLRQTALLANAWAGLGARTREVVAPGRHHFDVIAALAEPESPLVAAVVE